MLSFMPNRIHDVDSLPHLTTSDQERTMEQQSRLSLAEQDFDRLALVDRTGQGLENTMIGRTESKEYLIVHTIAYDIC